MPSYVINGASRGLGWEFLDQLSSDPKNTVIGIVRTKGATEKRVAEELSGRSNISILEATLTDSESLKRAASETAAITGGSLDYLISNGAYLSWWEFFGDIDDLAKNEPEQFARDFDECFKTNVLGNVWLISHFMPLVLKSSIKKVLVVSSGAGDMEMVRHYEVANSANYSASKAALNMIVAKFHAQYKKDGVLFLSVCPGMVATSGDFSKLNEKESAKLNEVMGKYQRYSPDFKGPDQPYDSVKAVLSVLDNSSVEKHDGGAYLSHFGNKRWI